MPAEATAATMAPKRAPWRALMDAAIAAKGAKAEVGAGVILLHARDAKVHGSKLRYEDQPHKDTLGFWVQKDDWVEWTFMSPGTGSFEVDLLQACGKGSGHRKGTGENHLRKELLIIQQFGVYPSSAR